MSTFTSASTYAQVTAAYDDNASYEEDASVAKAKSFITACRFILRRVPTRSGKGAGGETEFDQTIVRDEMDKARRWLGGQTSAGGGGGAIYGDFRDMRV